MYESLRDIALLKAYLDLNIPYFESDINAEVQCENELLFWVRQMLALKTVMSRKIQF